MTTCALIDLIRMRPCGRRGVHHVRVWLTVGIEARVPMCAACMVLVSANAGRLVDGVIRAAHPMDVPCRHPHGEWHDDGCVLPVTTDTIEDVRVGEEVPA